jgi:hypothetical protein
VDGCFAKGSLIRVAILRKVRHVPYTHIVVLKVVIAVFSILVADVAIHFRFIYYESNFSNFDGVFTKVYQYLQTQVIDNIVKLICIFFVINLVKIRNKSLGLDKVKAS